MPAAELTQRYVDCLEQFPAIWDSRTRSYSNKDAKNAAWQSLANLIGVTVPEAQTIHKTNRTYFQKVCEVIYYLQELMFCSQVYMDYLYLVHNCDIVVSR